MVSCAHLVGHDKFKKFIDSKGKTDKQDGNLVPCSEYLKKFGGYEYDFSTDALQAQLQQKQAQAEQPTAPQPAPAVQPQSDTNAQSTTATQPPQDTNNTQAAPAVQQPPKPQPVAADTKAAPQPAATAPQPEQPEQKPAAANDKIYEIQPNDKLDTIAKNNGMTIATLLNLPGNEKFKADPDKIKPGEKLNIDAAKAKLDTQILPDSMKEINEMQKNLDDSKHFE